MDDLYDPAEIYQDDDLLNNEMGVDNSCIQLKVDDVCLSDEERFSRTATMEKKWKTSAVERLEPREHNVYVYK